MQVLLVWAMDFSLSLAFLHDSALSLTSNIPCEAHHHDVRPSL